MTATDEVIALAASQGDRQAYDLLLRRHYDRILSLSWRLSGDFHEAQDLAQDLSLSLPRRLKGFRGQARFTTWLYRIVVNAVHDRRRAAGRRARHYADWRREEPCRRAGLAREQEALDLLREGVETLPDDLRETAILLVYEDMTQAQAAEILAIAPGTIAWRMSEVKGHLRRFVSDEARQESRAYSRQ